MCGIAGIWSFRSNDALSIDIQKMTDAIAHRGPDAKGHWVSANHSIALGHRRLSIIDLSENASQPMHYLDRFVISYNGEIYNYLELKEELEQKGYRFETKSDTEVVLAAYCEWKENCLLKFDGMFAIALYDYETNELFCARDRFGEKPFYYAFYEGSLIFGSEMKAFWALGLPKHHNKKMLFHYMVNDLVENPNDQTETFFENINKLKSSHYFIYKGQQVVHQQIYWQLPIETLQHLSAQEASHKFLRLLETSVKRRLRSDVTVGSSLSGGIDSSTIVALVSMFYDTNHTFSARFPGFKKDEGYFIDLMSKRFRTRHHNVEVNEQKLNSALDLLIWHQEEPFQTGSIFAQWCVYEKARQQNIIVMLDGQGADEFLAGYPKDFTPYVKELYHDNKNLHQFILDVKKQHGYNVALSLKEKLSVMKPKLYSKLAAGKRKHLTKIPKGIDSEFFNSYSSADIPFKEFDNLKSTLHYEMINQGLEKLLKFADRNSMAHGVEVRLPFLYHELVEFVFSLDSSLYFKDGWSKAILRTAMEDILPKEIVWRKDKVGFESPDNEWIKNKEIHSIYEEAILYLKNNKYITSQYNDKWKSIIAYKYLNL